MFKKLLWALCIHILKMEMKLIYAILYFNLIDTMLDRTSKKNVKSRLYIFQFSFLRVETAKKHVVQRAKLHRAKTVFNTRKSYPRKLGTPLFICCETR